MPVKAKNWYYLAMPLLHRTSLVAVCLALAGCLNSPVTLRYEPDAPARPLALDRKLRIFLAPVTDLAGGLQSSVIRVPLTRPLAESVDEALRLELGRLGLPPAGEASRADAVLNAAVAAAALGFDVNHLTMAGSGSIKILLSLSRPGGQTFWEGELLGEARSKPRLTQPNNNTIMSNALAAAMGRLGPLLESEGVIERLTSPGGGAFAANAAPAGARSDVDELPRPGLSARGRTHAVLIGLHEYRGALPKMPFADRDSRLFARYLTDALGYEDANVVTLINGQATKGDLEKHFERWLPNRVREKDEILVYYAGHGAVERATGKAYLLPYDGDLEFLEGTGYSIERLYRALGALPGRVTIVLDAGFEGAQLPEPPANVAALSAAAPGQTRRDNDAQGHGLFTYFLLKEIKRGIASGTLDFKAAFDAAAPQISDAARAGGGIQDPRWQGQYR